MEKQAAFTKFNQLSKYLISDEEIFKDVLKDNKKVFWVDYVYFNLLAVYEQKGLKQAAVSYGDETNKIVTASAFCQAAKKFNPYDIQSFAERLSLKHLKKQFPGATVHLIDASRLNICKNIADHLGKNFNTTPSENYRQATLTTLLNVSTKSPTCMLLTHSQNEREAFQTLIDKYVKPNDIVVFDRGYFSYDLANILNKKGINFLFRVPVSAKNISSLEGEDVPFKYEVNQSKSTKYINLMYDLSDCRKIEYFVDQPKLFKITPSTKGGKKIKITLMDQNAAETYIKKHTLSITTKKKFKKEQLTKKHPDDMDEPYNESTEINNDRMSNKIRYILFTNLQSDEYPAQRLKDLYHDRWKIEEFFKFYKSHLGGRFFNHRTYDSLMRRIYFQQLAMTIMSIIINTVERLLQQKVSKSKYSKKISNVNSLKPIVSLLGLMLYRPKGVTKLFHKKIDLITSSQCTTIQQPGRHFKRTNKVPQPCNKRYGK